MSAGPSSPPVAWTISARAEAALAITVAVVWISLLIFAFWAAFRASTDAVNFNLAAPWTFENFATAWASAPWLSVALASGGPLFIASWLGATLPPLRLLSWGALDSRKVATVAISRARLVPRRRQSAVSSGLGGEFAVLEEAEMAKVRQRLPVGHRGGMTEMRRGCVKSRRVLTGSGTISTSDAGIFDGRIYRRNGSLSAGAVARMSGRLRR